MHAEPRRLAPRQRELVGQGAVIIFMVAHRHHDRHRLGHDLAQPRKPVNRALADIPGDEDHIDPGQGLDRLDVGHVGVEIGEDVRGNEPGVLVALASSGLSRALRRSADVAATGEKSGDGNIFVECIPMKPDPA